MKFIILGDYNSNGQYGTGLFETSGLSSQNLTTLQSQVGLLLPERQKINNSEWLKDNVITVTGNSGVEVSMTFIDEGAAYKNTIIVAVIPKEYKKDIKRSTLKSHAQVFIMWPNLSKPHVKLGDTLSVPDYIHNESRLVHISGDLYKMASPLTSAEKIISKGSRVLFGLIPNAWKSTYVKTTTTPFYSQNNLNSETFKTAYVKNSINAHTVLLQSIMPEYTILGFEDVRRDTAGCDDDFNDAVFAIKISPLTAIDKKGAITVVDGVSIDDLTGPKRPKDFDVGYKKIIRRHVENGKSYDIECIARLLIPTAGTKCKDSSDLPAPKPTSGKSTVIICRDITQNDKSRTNYVYCDSITVCSVPDEVNGVSIGESFQSGVSKAHQSFIWSADTWYYEPNMDVNGSVNICSLPGLHYFSDKEKAISF